MKQAKVFRNGVLAGILTKESRNKYSFRYTDAYFSDDSMPAVSLTLRKNKQLHKADHLFPYFYNMLPEGVNKKLQCRRLKIDENDYFSLLLAVADSDPIGAVHIKEIKITSE